MSALSYSKKLWRILSSVICAGALFLSFLCFFTGRWYVGRFGRLGFDCVLYTLTVNLTNVQKGQVWGFLLQSLTPAILFTGLSLWLLTKNYPSRRKGKYQSRKRRGIRYPLAVLLSLGLCLFAAFDVELIEYLFHQNANSRLYESKYVDPQEVEITFPSQKKNLIYIILESMETTYLSKDLGGAMEDNLIPELYDLTQQHLSFSDFSPGSTAGYHTTSGATWTIGSMVAQTAGIPLKTPTEDVNQYGADGEAFLPGVTTLMDILQEAGYYQTLMVGSDANFGGRKQYYSQHGVNEILDLYSARADGIVPHDYFVWWGMEDLHLFEYAKQELLELSSQSQPFAFTMLTVDTHHVGGYPCALCQQSKSGENYDRVISCSSKQVSEFVKWIQQQDFAENTAVVIVGDHKTMDNGYIERMVDQDYPQRLYHCFLNSAVQPQKTGSRSFCAVDLFPTTLAAIGCTIEGDRLGLGVNLFSKQETLLEIYGFDAIDNELSKASAYYETHFWE